ncbi:UNVERIFIED_ORG: glucan phosphoethanolaminetransferase (alkaline phosphatase superfamily) [Buttiauxella agrestis ATCC 33320]
MAVMETLKKLQCNDSKFNLYCAFFFTIINFLLIKRSWEIIEPNSFHSWIFAISVPVVLFSAWLIIFSLINLPWLRKPLLVILVPGCAACNYFMFTCGAVIDKNMMTNVVTLVTPQLLMWTGLTGIVSAVFLATIKIKPSCWWYTLLSRTVGVLAGLLIIILVASVFYKDYASLFRNHKNIVKILPPDTCIRPTGLLQFFP